MVIHAYSVDIYWLKQQFIATEIHCTASSRHFCSSEVGSEQSDIIDMAPPQSDLISLISDRIRSDMDLIRFINVGSSQMGSDIGDIGVELIGFDIGDWDQI